MDDMERFEDAARQWCQQRAPITLHSNSIPILSAWGYYESPIVNAEQFRLTSSTRMHNRKKPILLMELPQELLDLILSFAFPSDRGTRTMTKYSSNYANTYTKTPPFPDEPDFFKKLFFSRKVDEMLVSKRFFHCAARQYVSNCSPEIACCRMYQGMLLEAYGRHFISDIFDLLCPEGFANIRSLRLRLDMKVMIQMIIEQRDRRVQLYGGVASFAGVEDYLHDNLIDAWEIQDALKTKTFLRSRGITNLRFLWEKCCYCRKHKRRPKTFANVEAICRNNKLAFKNIIWEYITQRRDERHQIRDRIALYPEAGDPLYPGSAVSWTPWTPKAVERQKPRTQPPHEVFESNIRSPLKRTRDDVEELVRGVEGLRLAKADSGAVVEEYERPAKFARLSFAR